MPTSAAAHVDQRAAGIARVDGRVRLDEELVIGDADLGARQRRDDALRHGLADAEGVADGEHEVADLQALRNRRARGPAGSVASFSLSTARSVRGSRSTISASNSRRSASATFTSVMFSMTWLLVITSPDGSTITPEPRELWERPARHAGRVVAEEAAEELLHGGVLPALGARGIDVDHGPLRSGGRWARTRAEPAPCSREPRAAPGPVLRPGQGASMAARHADREVAKSAYRSNPVFGGRHG